MHTAGAQSLQGKVFLCTLCEAKHKCLLGMCFSLCWQFLLAISQTTYVKLRREFISVIHLWKPGSFQMSLFLPPLLPGTTLGNCQYFEASINFDTTDTLTASHLQQVLSAPQSANRHGPFLPCPWTLPLPLVWMHLPSNCPLECWSCRPLSPQSSGFLASTPVHVNQCSLSPA